uniref:acid phosphatase n=1 Tax=Sandarakinorhabdus sp. TaxID=1916663 RepID=UPI00286DDDC3
PPPPAPGSAQARADTLIYKDSRREIGGPLWKKAQGQLSPSSPAFITQLSCALGAAISPAATPATFTLVRRAGTDIAPAIDTAKKYYARPRPFTTDGGKACDPASAEGKGKERGAKLGFAYPSGHAAIGWLWGMILSDVRPERSAAILKFGQETGDLRMACRVHWLSDVTHGRLMATAFYQRIAATPEYQADVERARSEIALAKVPEGCGG